MITIVKPHSVYADRTDANEFELEWSSTVSGQTGYEIYYKLSNAANWSTTGLISDPTATTYDLRQIYSLVELDFTEIIYKIKIYYSTENEEGLLTGVEESDIYTIIFSQPISGYLSVYDGEEIERYPLFSSIESSYDKLKVHTNDGNLATVLVDNTSPIASNMKIHVGNDNLTLASEYASGLSYTQNAHGEFEQDGYETAYYYYNTNEHEQSYETRLYSDKYYYYTYRTYMPNTPGYFYSTSPSYYYKYYYQFYYIDYYYRYWGGGTNVYTPVYTKKNTYAYSPSSSYYYYGYNKSYTYYYYNKVYDGTTYYLYTAYDATKYYYYSYNNYESTMTYAYKPNYYYQYYYEQGYGYSQAYWKYYSGSVPAHEYTTVYGYIKTYGYKPSDTYYRYYYNLKYYYYTPVYDQTTYYGYSWTYLYMYYYTNTYYNKEDTYVTPYAYYYFT